MNKQNSEAVFDPEKLPFFRREQAFEPRKGEDFHQFTVEVAADEVFLMRSDSQIVYVNQSACNKLGYQPSELVGKFVWEWDPLFPQAAWPGFWQEVVSAKHVYFETQHRNKAGKVFPVEIHGHYFEQNGEPYLVALVTDLTERKQNEALIYKQANYDQLTGLPNRYFFMDRLEHALTSAARSKQKVALLFLDLDFFKAINDEYGHHIGDQLLSQAATRLKESVREADTVARLGGDEFVIILENVDNTDLVSDVAAKLRHKLCQPYLINGMNLEVGCSVGMALYPDHADNTAQLLICADKGMYAAKEASRNLE